MREQTLATHLVDVRFRPRNIVHHRLDHIGDLRKDVHLLNQALKRIRVPDFHDDGSIYTPLRIRYNRWPRPPERELRRRVVPRVRIVHGFRVRRARDYRSIVRLLLPGPLRLRGDRRELPAQDDRADVDGDEARAGALLPVVVRRRKLHLDRGHAAVRLGLEVREVPARGNEVRAHALNRVHEHAGALDRRRVALMHEEARRGLARPEAVDDVPVGVLRVMPEVRKAAVGPAADLEARRVRGAGDVEGDLEVIVEVGGEGVALGLVGAGLGLVRDGELVSFGGPLVEPRWGSGEVGHVDRLPDLLLSVGVVDLAGELDGRIPHSARAVQSRGPT